MGGGVQSDQFSTIKYNGLIDIIVIILQLQGPGGGSPPALYIYTIYLFQRLGADIHYTVHCTNKSWKYSNAFSSFGGFRSGYWLIALLLCHSGEIKELF